ncbi:hypothetical protein Tco_1067286 [Tanacetum coccineum]|uniref:Uncharacterized protein n=1 Tax=Tanacetum coccineum TaxID=301880 RepID=A0ABQ5HCF2_9ASTR
MTTLQFADTHNLVAFLSKPAESERFEQIFWSTVKEKTVNGEVQLQALVDGKKIIVTEASVRSDLQLDDEEGIDCLPNATIFEELTRMNSKTTAWNEFSSTMASAIICLAINQKFNFSKYIFESMVKNLRNVSLFWQSLNVSKMRPSMRRWMTLGRAATTYLATSLDCKQIKGNINKNQSKATPNNQVSLSKRVESSNEECLGKEDASKHGRIADIDADAGINLVSTHFDANTDMFRVHDLDAFEKCKSYEKANVVEEPSESITTTPTLTTTTAATTITADKCKGKMVEPEHVKKLSKKDILMLDEELAFKLQAEEEEERLAREKAQQIKEVNIAWDDVQARVKVDYQLAQRLQAQEQEELTDEEKVRLFVNFLKQRRKYFAAKRAEEKRNRPLTRAQQRSFMCTYLKNMEGWKPKDLKNKPEMVEEVPRKRSKNSIKKVVQREQALS